MTDQSDLIRIFAAYAHTMALPYKVGEALYELTEQSVDMLDLDVDGAGVSVSDDAKLKFVTATDEGVVRIEEEQIASHEGPCYDAHHSGQQITSADLNEESRWPSYTPVALSQGCVSVAGIPMFVGEQKIGALNLYRRRSADWSTDDRVVSQLLADMATGYIVNAQNLSKSQQVAEQLQAALNSRVIIEQAKGMLAERMHIPPAEAFQALRQHARSHRQNIHVVASGVVDGTLTL